MCVEDRGVTMEDGITHIYLNARAVRKNVSEELAVLLDYIAGKEEKSSELTDALQREVNRYNKDEDWRHWSMTFEEELNEAREEARQEMMENIFFAFAMFRDGKSDEEIFRTERFSSIEQVKELRKKWRDSCVTA